MGYDIRSRKYTPAQFIENTNTLKLNFDHVIYRHLATRPGEFVFIQVGAFNGMDCDPLYEFIGRYSWKGVLIEPQPQAFRQLSTLHGENPRLQLVNAAISRERSRSKFYVLEGDELPSWSRGMASFNIEHILKHRDIIPSVEKHIVETEIDCITFKDLFDQTRVSRLDLLQVDTEGFDAEVIYMFPFDRMKPDIIHFESKHLNKESLEKLLDYLIGLGYSVAYDGTEDMLAVLDPALPRMQMEAVEKI